MPDEMSKYKIQFNKSDLGEAELKAAEQVMNSSWFNPGNQTELFEKEFAKFVGAKYAIFTNNCTSALKMAYRWAKQQGYKTAYYPLNTYCATYSAAHESGLQIAPYLDKAQIKLSKKSFFINMHFGGVKDNTECLIEDSAHRLEPNDPLVGKIRCYSFSPNKNITTVQGGMAVTNDKKIADKFKLWQRDGRVYKERFDYSIKELSGGYENNELAAAIGRVQLKKLRTINKKRNLIVKQYNKAFGQNWQGNHLYPIELESENKVKKFIRNMDKMGIECSWHYPHTSTCASLPLYPSLSQKEIDYIITCTKKCLDKA